MTGEGVAGGVVAGISGKFGVMSGGVSTGSLVSFIRLGSPEEKSGDPWFDRPFELFGALNGLRPDARFGGIGSEVVRPGADCRAT